MYKLFSAATRRYTGQYIFPIFRIALCVDNWLKMLVNQRRTTLDLHLLSSDVLQFGLKHGLFQAMETAMTSGRKAWTASNDRLYSVATLGFAFNCKELPHVFHSLVVIYCKEHPFSVMICCCLVIFLLGEF